MQKLDIESGTNLLYFIYSLTGRGGLACAMLSSGANSIFSNKMQASEFDSYAVLHLNMVRLCVCIFEHTHVCTHTHTHIHTHMDIHMDIHAHMHARTHTHIMYRNKHMYTHHLCKFTLPHTCTPLMQIHIHTHTNAHCLL